MCSNSLAPNRLPGAPAGSLQARNRYSVVHIPSLTPCRIHRTGLDPRLSACVWLRYFNRFTRVHVPAGVQYWPIRIWNVLCNFA